MKLQINVYQNNQMLKFKLRFLFFELQSKHIATHTYINYVTLRGSKILQISVNGFTHINNKLSQVSCISTLK